MSGSTPALSASSTPALSASSTPWKRRWTYSVKDPTRLFTPRPTALWGGNGYVTGAPVGSTSVILEFSIPASEFQLGEALSGSSVQLELERIVPTGNTIMPFVWATGDDHDRFAETVRSHPNVRELLALDRVGDSGLYRIEWETPPKDPTEANLGGFRPGRAVKKPKPSTA